MRLSLVLVRTGSFPYLVLFSIVLMFAFPFPKIGAKVLAGGGVFYVGCGTI